MLVHPRDPSAARLKREAIREYAEPLPFHPMDRLASSLVLAVPWKLRAYFCANQGLYIPGCKSYAVPYTGTGTGFTGTENGFRKGISTIKNGPTTYLVP
jgi:hypothetical protein